MYNNRSVFALIPARGGSKGLPRKNIKPLLGKPLVAWSIEQAGNCAYLDRSIVSTDDPGIADVARRFGGDVPFMRPPALARDESKTSDVILHAIEYLEKNGQHFDYVCLLEPTSPLRAKDDVDRAIQTLVENDGADSLVTVGEVHCEHPLIVKKIVDNVVVPYIDNTRLIHQRQQADLAYFPYGVVYMAKVDVFKKLQTFYTPRTMPLYIERWQNYEIDDEIDFQLVELLMERCLNRQPGH
jgi:CMP-N-acetylneuraminic acid synthetase